MGKWIPPYYGNSKFYAKKKEKCLAKIAKFKAKIEAQREIVAECDKQIADGATK